METGLKCLVLKLHYCLHGVVNGLLFVFAFFEKNLFQENCLVASLTSLSGEGIKARLALADTAVSSDRACRKGGSWLKLFHLQGLCFPPETLGAQYFKLSCIINNNRV